MSQRCEPCVVLSLESTCYFYLYISLVKSPSQELFHRIPPRCSAQYPILDVSHVPLLTHSHSPSGRSRIDLVAINCAQANETFEGSSVEERQRGTPFAALSCFPAHALVASFRRGGPRLAPR